MRLASKKSIHDGDSVLRWVVDNIFVITDPAGNIKTYKEKSTEKIDSAEAMITALDRAIRNEGNNGWSIYNEKRIILI